MDRRFLEKKKKGKRKKYKKQKQKNGNKKEERKSKKKKEKEKGRKRRKKKGRKKKTPCMGSGHPVVGKIFKMFEFQGFNMLTLRIGPFWVDEKKFSFYEKKVEKNF